MQEYAKAERLFQRTLNIYQKVFGVEHTKTAATLCNLCFLFVI